MQQAVSDLTRERDDPWLRSGFAIAKRFHEDFFHDYREDCRIEANRPVARDLVIGC